MKHPILILLLLLPVLHSTLASEEEAELEIGPDKGVTALAPDKSFKISPEAKETFGIQTVSFSQGTATIPTKAVVSARTETQIFRVREDFYKPVHFRILKRSDQTVTIHSDELKPGDQIVTQGGGFLRIIAVQLGEKEGAESPKSAKETEVKNAENEGSHD